MSELNSRRKALQAAMGYTVQEKNEKTPILINSEQANATFGSGFTKAQNLLSSKIQLADLAASEILTENQSPSPLTVKKPTLAQHAKTGTGIRL